MSNKLTAETSIMNKVVKTLSTNDDGMKSRKIKKSYLKTRNVQLFSTR